MRVKPRCFSEEGASSSCWQLSSGWGTQTGGPLMHPPGLAMHSSSAALTTTAQPDSKVFITSYTLGRAHLQPSIKSPSCHKPHFCMCKMPPNCPFFCLFFGVCSQSAQQYKVFTLVCSGHREKKKGIHFRWETGFELISSALVTERGESSKEKPKRDTNREDQTEHFCSSLFNCLQQVIPKSGAEVWFPT